MVAISHICPSAWLDIPVISESQPLWSWYCICVQKNFCGSNNISDLRINFTPQIKLCTLPLLPAIHLDYIKMHSLINCKAQKPKPYIHGNPQYNLTSLYTKYIAKLFFKSPLLVGASQQISVLTKITHYIILLL